MNIQYSHHDGKITNDANIVIVKPMNLPIKDKKDYNSKMDKFNSLENKTIGLKSKFFDLKRIMNQQSEDFKDKKKSVKQKELFKLENKIKKVKM